MNFPIIAIAFTLFYFLLGLLVTKRLLGKHLPEGSFVFIAPAIGLLIVGIISALSYLLNFDLLIPIFSLCVLVAALFNYKFIVSFLKNLKKFAVFTLLAVVALFIFQTIAFNTNAKTSPHYTGLILWDIFDISGGVTPPDQSFSWHQARFLLNDLEYPKDEFYGDIDFFDRPVFGGLIMYYPGYFIGIEPEKENSPDQNTAINAKYEVYIQVFWLLNNLYLVGLALVVKYLFKRRTTIVVLFIAAMSPVAFLLATGLWMKMLPVYLFSIVFYLHTKRKLPLLQGVLAGMTFLVHNSSLIFLAMFGVEIMLEVTSNYFRNKHFPASQFSYMLKFGLTSVIIIAGWFGLVRYVNAPDSLTFAYRYNSEWSLADDTNKDKLIDDFYNSTNNRNLIALPLINVLKSVLPLESINFVQNFSLTDKNYLSGQSVVNAVSETESIRSIGIMGFFMMPLIVVGSVGMINDKKLRINFFTLFLLPLLTMAVLYRRDNIITNHITSLFVLYAAIAVGLFVSRIKPMRVNWSVVLIIAFAAFGHLFTVLFSIRRWFEWQVEPWVSKFTIKDITPWFPYIGAVLATAVIVALYYHSGKSFEPKRNN